MMKRLLGIAVALAVPALLAAQTPIPASEHASETAKAKLIPSEHASDRAKERVGAAMARRATHVRGEAVTPAIPATPATRATPAPRVTPASPSNRPADAGTGHGRRP